MSQCHCFIYHPQDENQRKTVSANLDKARNIGDGTGIAIALAQLTGHCPSRERQEKEQCK